MRADDIDILDLNDEFPELPDPWFFALAELDE